MSNTDRKVEPPPLPGAQRGKGGTFFGAAFLSLASLYMLLKITLEITRVVKPIYMEAGTALPLVTVQAMNLIDGALHHGRLTLGLPPLIIATGYVLLASRPRLRRICVVTLIAAAVLVAGTLIVFLTLPLFATAGSE